MNTSVLTSVDRDVGPVLVPLTTQQYHAMIASGILKEGDPIELIDGLLVRRDRRDSGGSLMTVGPRHALVLKQLVPVLEKVLGGIDCHVQAQLPVTLTGISEPEPDVCVIAGTPQEYANHHPGAADVLLVIEIADSSLSYDRTTKYELYSAAGIQEYWIVNLQDDVVEIHRRPLPNDNRYTVQTSRSSAHSLKFILDKQTFEIDLMQVF